MRKIMALLVTLAMLMLSVGTAAAQSTPSQAPVDPIDGCDYYEETGHNLCDTFLAYWEANGGLPVFGYPITEEYQEENLDTGEVYTVQYFERERMEHHTALAGSVYEVLLGRLGNEVLLMQGRDWQTFEKSGPSEPNYMDETGFAVAPQFIGYWASHGLDFGEPGFSFRESLALFGYPISRAEVETNAAGHTVLTQWFERARFEFHPDNPEGQQVLLGLLGVEVLDVDEPEPPPPPEPEPEPDFTVVAEGLDNPRHISVGGDGALYVAEAGSGGDECTTLGEGDESFELCFGLTGAVTRIADGEAEQVVTGLPSVSGTGPHDVVVTAEGEIYVLFGLGGPPEGRDLFENEAVAALGTLARIEEDGSWTIVADLAAYEGEVNPDPAFVDTNPYAMTMDGENFIVADAGGNTLLQVTPDGEITTLAVFPAITAADGETMLDSVPTTVVTGPDGAYYVGELTGEPTQLDAARVWRVVPGEDPEVYAMGFTNIGAIDFDSEGNLYVLEILAAGFSEDAPPFSAVIKVALDGTQTPVPSGGLIFATGLAIAADDSIYVVNQAVFPGEGQVVLLEGEAETQE